MIFDTPVIKVSGITFPVYAADFSWGGADSPSKMTVDFVNKNGTYKTPVLNTSQVATIELGDFFTFKGYPVSWSKSNSVAGNVISVTYWDTSVLLDKIFVGLKGVHGAPPRNISDVLDGTVVEGTFDSRMLLLGTYVDPCDGVTDDYTDPCNPCLTRTEFVSLGESNNEKRIACDEARQIDLLDVHYTFEELISGLRSRGVQLLSLPTVASTFYARHTGTAREVLKSWCSDLGMTFYWDGDGIKFVDLRKGIIINNENFYTACKLLSTTESESIENNYSQGNILYFGGPGRLEKYNCNAGHSYKLSLLPITLKDIFVDTNGMTNPYIRRFYTRSGQENSIRGLQSSVFLSKYSQMLRDMTLLYDFYGVSDASAIADGTKMPLLGLTIKNSWDITDTSAESANARSLFWNYIPESIRKRAQHIGAAIAVVEYNKSWHDAFYKFEANLANDFVGRYWISFFSKGERYSYEAPDGQVNYFDAGTPLTLPFAHVIPQSMRSHAGFLTKIINDSAQLNVGVGHVGDVRTANPNSFASSFLLMDRTAAWEPTENSDDTRNFEDRIEDMYLFNVETFKEEGFSDTLAVGETYALIFDRPATFSLTEYDPRAHPIESSNTNRILELDTYTTSYGLRSDLCRTYRLEVKVVGSATQAAVNQRFDFATPVQAYDNYGIEFAGYAVVATENSTSKMNSKVLIPRAEMIVGDMPRQADESVGIQVNFKDLSNQLQEIMTETTNGCGYNIAEIRSLIDEFKVGSSRPKQVKSTSFSYTLAGFPTRELALEDGLSGFSIRYDTSKGITTEIQFNNTPPITRSDNVRDQETERNIMKRRLGKRFLSSDDNIDL